MFIICNFPVQKYKIKKSLQILLFFCLQYWHYKIFFINFAFEIDNTTSL